jgi:hypothetical protein
MISPSAAATAQINSIELIGADLYRCRVKLIDIGVYYHEVHARTPEQAERYVRKRLDARDRVLKFGPYRGGQEKRTLKQARANSVKEVKN